MSQCHTGTYITVLFNMFFNGLLYLCMYVLRSFLFYNQVKCLKKKRTLKDLNNISIFPQSDFLKSKTIKQNIQDFSFDVITFMKLLVKSTSVNIHNATYEMQRHKCCGGGLSAGRSKRRNAALLQWYSHRGALKDNLTDWKLEQNHAVKI